MGVKVLLVPDRMLPKAPLPYGPLPMPSFWDAVGWAVPTIFPTTSRARFVNSFLINPQRIE